MRRSMGDGRRIGNLQFANSLLWAFFLSCEMTNDVESTLPIQSYTTTYRSVGATVRTVRTRGTGVHTAGLQ